MSLLHAIILGIVEGVTEFLPISSTAHLMMASKILSISQTEFLKSFEIVIQLGAILAVVVVFGKRLLSSATLWKRVMVAFVPTAIIGFVLYKLIKSYLIGNLPLALWTLVIGGVILVAVEYFFLKKRGIPSTGKEAFESGVDNISSKQAFYIGVAQSLAIIPGVSRSAATIVSALFFGASRKAAAEFSFLLAVPTVAAAAGYDVLKNFNTITANGNISLLAVGFIVSFISALVSIKWMLAYIQRHSFTFTAFGIYRIIVPVAFLLYLKFF